MPPIIDLEDATDHCITAKSLLLDKMTNNIQYMPEFVEIVTKYRETIDNSPAGITTYEDLNGDGIEDTVHIRADQDTYQLSVQISDSLTNICSFPSSFPVTLCRADVPKNSPFKIEYSVNREMDSKTFIGMLYRRNDPSGIKNRAQRMGVNGETLKKIQAAGSREEALSIMKPFIDKKYEHLGPNLAEEVCLRQRRWNKINDDFFHYVNNRVGSDFEYSNYTILISPVNPGVSNRLGNVVSRGAVYNEESLMRIDAHEVLLAHMYRYLHDHFGNNLNIRQSWALGEISTVLLLDEMNSLFPEFNAVCQGGLYFACSNYKKVLPPIESEVRAIYTNTPDFAEFIEKAALRILDFDITF